MRKIQFLRDTGTADLDLPDRSVILYREGFGYRVPNVTGAEYMEWLDFKTRYTTMTPEMFVVVGLNRIITPSNRCDLVNEYLQTMTPNIPKICVDTAPWIGEPWRLWWHYSIAAAGRWGVSYSYAIETEWKKWFYRETPDCRLSGENIRMFISDTISDLDPLSVSFEFVEPGGDDEAWYAEVKAEIFERHATPKMWINALLRAANARYGLDLAVDTYRNAAPDLFGPQKIVVPDIGVYRFVAEENIRRAKIYNEVISYERR